MQVALIRLDAGTHLINRLGLYQGTIFSRAERRKTSWTGFSPCKIPNWQGLKSKFTLALAARLNRLLKKSCHGLVRVELAFRPASKPFVFVPESASADGIEAAL